MTEITVSSCQKLNWLSPLDCVLNKIVSNLVWAVNSRKWIYEFSHILLITIGVVSWDMGYPCCYKRLKFRTIRFMGYTFTDCTQRRHFISIILKYPFRSIQFSNWKNSANNMLNYYVLYSLKCEDDSVSKSSASCCQKLNWVL